MHSHPDMPADEFRRHAHRLADWIADYLEGSQAYPVTPSLAPGEIRDSLPDSPPDEPEDFSTILDDFEHLLVPGLTHWNHPRFFAYFAITASAPGVLGEFLSAALNQQAMLWRTSPVATELEEVTLDWLRQAMGLPADFQGVIYDTASISTLHALAAAREAAGLEVRSLGMAGRKELAPLRVYCSEEAHSSVDKAVILLGLGHQNLVRIPTDDRLRLLPQELERAISDDLEAGRQPLAVVATVGTTSTTSIDPVPAVADVCAHHRLWLHVDAAYGGAVGLVKELRHHLDGCERADSFVVNPHKWLFTPFDLSAFYCRRMDSLRAAFSLVPEYLKTGQGAEVRNLMDTGIQLGRRFRSLKLWMIMRSFGVRGMARRIAHHVELAHELADKVDHSQHFERLAPTPLSVVCLRACPKALRGDEEALEGLNERLMEAVNRGGEVFLSHTRVKGTFALRVAIGNIRTTREDVDGLWARLQEELERLL